MSAHVQFSDLVPVRRSRFYFYIWALPRYIQNPLLNYRGTALDYNFTFVLIHIKVRHSIELEW